jgi:hypothetical protein
VRESFFTGEAAAIFVGWEEKTCHLEMGERMPELTGNRKYVMMIRQGD